jgi:hypothetical protein
LLAGEVDLILNGGDTGGNACVCLSYIPLPAATLMIDDRDKVVYNDVTYICNGAVSGAWPEGNRRQTA